MKASAAVLTGDLIGSTAAGPAAVSAAMLRIETVAERLDAPFQFARFRGDGWQIYLDEPGLGLATALRIIASLRAAEGLESRIAVGLGDAVFAQAATASTDLSLGSATGSAFTASGRALDEMQKNRRLVVAGSGLDRLHYRLVSMIDARVLRWSHEQAEVLETALGPGNVSTQEWMAEKHGITRQAVAARLRAADFAQVNGAAVDFYLHFSKDHTNDD